jgi:hypothetical protein
VSGPGRQPLAIGRMGHATRADSVGGSVLHGWRPVNDTFESRQLGELPRIRRADELHANRPSILP